MGCSAAMMAAVDVQEPEQMVEAIGLPPYNGYGSLEDSAENCRHLIPRPPKKNIYKIANKSKIILRFGARLSSTAQRNVPDDHRWG